MIGKAVLLALSLAGIYTMGGTGKGGTMRVLDGIDQLVSARNESVEALSGIIRRPLKPTEPTRDFDVAMAKFPEDSPFNSIEVQKSRSSATRAGSIVVDIRLSDCIGSEVVVERYGQVNDLVPPRAFGPPGRPTEYIYKRPWGTLNFGFVKTERGECLSQVVIDWTK